MKRIFSIVLLAVLTLQQELKAQPGSNTIEIQSWSWGASNSSGAQTVPVPGGKGTLKFTKQGDRFTNMVFVDAAGRSYRLSPVQPGTSGAPQPTCKYPLPDACFSTPDKNIGLCICKPSDLSSGGTGDYLIGMLLPAVQKAR